MYKYKFVEITARTSIAFRFEGFRNLLRNTPCKVGVLLRQYQ